MPRARYDGGVKIFISRAQFIKFQKKLFHQQLLGLALLVLLPVFVWAALTQRTELRKRATDSTTVCWNRVIQSNDTYTWPDGCKGDPNGQNCTQVLVPLTADELTAYNAWVASGSPVINECGIIATPTPTPSITATPAPCVRGTPTLTIDNQNQQANPGVPLTYTITLLNNDSISCQATGFNLSINTPTNGWTSTFNPYKEIPPQTSAIIPVIITSPSDTSAQQYFINFYTTSGASVYHTLYLPLGYTVIPFPTTSISPTQQTLRFTVRLGGITDNKAEGAKISVKFLMSDGTTMQLSNSLTLSHTGNGVYEAQAVLANALPAGTKFSLLIKGEKHVAVKFCRQTGQTGPCGSNETITVPNPSPLTYGFDLTGIPLPPGDVYLQDGMANKADFDKLTVRMSKLCSDLTAEDKLIADLDYNGCINVRDVFLMKQTLETRYDEQ